MADEDAPGGSRRPGADEGDISRRLARLGANLDAKRDASTPRSGPGASASDPGAMGRAVRVSSELVACVIVGFALGWAFDRGLGTKPWGLIGFLMLGFVAGIYNVMRASGFLKPAGPAKATAAQEPHN